ncbi:MAG: tetratricopeptide repeat protein [Myxococcota bacterium]
MTELRIANLRRELDAETDARAQAAILYEIGILEEHDLERPSAAAGSYEHAAEVDPLFQPPLIARLRLAERAPNGVSIEALCDAQVAAANTDILRAAALVDLALCTDQSVDLLREAIRVTPRNSGAALLLEWIAGNRGDPEAVLDAIHAQAIAATEPALRGALWLEVGLVSFDLGRIDEGLAALTQAAETPEVALHAHSLAVRIAREHQRWPMFDRAALALAKALERCADQAEPSDPLAAPMPREHFLPAAVLLLAEVGARRLETLGDAGGALSAFEEALRLQPHDLGIRLQALSAAEAIKDQATIDEACAWFLEHQADHPGFIAHKIRRAIASADVEAARHELATIHGAFPASPLASASLDVATIRAQAIDARIANLQRRGADGSSPDGRSVWRAAQLATEQSVHDVNPHQLYDEAIRLRPEAADTIEREALGACIFQEDWTGVVRRCESLLCRDLDFDERAILGYCKYEALKRAGSKAEAEAFLSESVSEPAHQRWAPSIARTHAAWTGNLALLRSAHEALASGTSGEERVGHLCAVAQTHAREQRWEACEEALRRALQEVPDDPYALSLLEGVMRESGRPETAVSLVSKRSKSTPGAALDELALLLAGASAERDGNLPAARHAYEVAMKSAPSSPSAALALLDIARKQDDRGAAIRALGALARGDSADTESERFSVLEGDALLEVGRAEEAAEAYESALDHPVTELEAAVGLLMTPARATTEAQRHAAERILAGRAPARPEGTGFEEVYGAWREGLAEGGDSSEVWFRWSDMAPNERLRARALLEGLRTMAIAQGADAADDVFLKAQDAEPLAAQHPAAAIALDEAISAGDDATFRVTASSHRLEHADEVGRSSQQAAHWRALVDAGRGVEAVPHLTAALDRRPDDLALWEALRTAARQTGDWALVALCCDRLAGFVEGPLRADLLEEAGVVRLDHLGQERQAEDLFRSALAADPTRGVSFRRLHDLLTAREDADGLDNLVTARLAEGGGDGREDLLYERARLLRGFSEREEALEVLGELLAVSPRHPGALALASEIYVSLERWEDAVGSLRRLADAEIPAAQKRIAHLGAADFLESRIGAPAEALEELRAVDALDLADVSILNRVASLEENLGNTSDAAAAFERALSLEPTNRDAAAGVSRTSEEPIRDRMLASFEDALWDRIAPGVLEGEWLVDLRNAAVWRSHPRRTAAANRIVAVLSLTEPRPEDGETSPVFDAVPSDELADDPAPQAHRRIVALVGPTLDKRRRRTRSKVVPSTPVYDRLEHLCGRFDARIGTVSIGTEPSVWQASVNRHGQVDWVVPSQAKPDVAGTDLFQAGRLAWLTPRGGAPFLEITVEQATAKLAAVVRASKREVISDLGGIPRVETKLARSLRRSVSEILGEEPTPMTALEATARWFQQSADRAGLLAVEDIEIALASLVARDRVTIDALRASPRAIDLLRFWLDSRSPLWRHHG